MLTLGKVFGSGDTGQFRIAAVGYSGVMPGCCIWLPMQVSMPSFTVVTVATHVSFLVGSEGFHSYKAFSLFR